MNSRCFICVLFCLLLCGCPATIITSDPAHTARQTEAPRTPARRDMSLPGQARAAWNAGNMAEAERLYGIIARNPQSAPADLAGEEIRGMKTRFWWSLGFLIPLILPWLANARLWRP